MRAQSGGICFNPCYGHFGFWTKHLCELAPPEIAAMSAVLAGLLGDPALREHIAAASRARIGICKASAVVPRIEAIYREVIAGCDISVSVG